MIRLPKPRLDGPMSLERAMLVRRSVREFADEPLSLEQVANLLWAAQGITDPSTGFRATPSAGSLFPLEAILIAGNVQGLAPAAYRYVPREHALTTTAECDQRKPFATACFGQAFIEAAPATIVFSAVYQRTIPKYGDLTPALIHMEMGHAAQNVSLQAVTLGLEAVCIGAMLAPDVVRMLGLAADELPEYAVSVGKRQTP